MTLYNFRYFLQLFSYFAIHRTTSERYSYIRTRAKAYAFRVHRKAGTCDNAILHEALYALMNSCT